jgi:transcriptional regulator GlxA family with amidase domain
VTIEALLPLIARLHEEPCSDNRLRTLAQRVGLSPTHLQRVFSRMIGESPKRIARRIALERAAAVLVTSDAPILEIALASGFESHEGFTRAFRAQFERSPSHYRACGLAGSNSMLPEVSATHRDVVENVGPCICLFGPASPKPP